MQLVFYYAVGRTGYHLWVYDMMNFVREWWFLILLFGSGIWTLNSTLVSIKHQLERYNDLMKESKEDRAKLHLRVDKVEDVNDIQNEKLGRHHERINNLEKWKNRGGN